MDTVLRRYTFKLYPTAAQTEALKRQCKLHAWLWNAALQERMDCYRLTGKSLSYYDQAKHLKTVRADDPEYRALSADSMARTLASLDLAFKAFFRRVKERAKQRKGKRSEDEDKLGFPRFKSSERHDTIPFRDGTGWKMTAASGNNWRFHVKGVAALIKARGQFPCDVAEYRTMEVLRRDGRWWASVVVRVAARRIAGTADLKIDFDLIDEFAKVELANSGCAAADSLNAGSRKSTAFSGGYSGITGGHPESGVDPQGHTGAATPCRAGGHPESGVDPQVDLAEELPPEAGGHPESGVDPQGYGRYGRCRLAGGHPENGVDPQANRQVRHRRNPGGHPENGVDPQEHYCEAGGAGAGGHPENGVDPQAYQDGRVAPISGGHPENGVADSKSFAEAQSANGERLATDPFNAGSRKHYSVPGVSAATGEATVETGSVGGATGKRSCSSRGEATGEAVDAIKSERDRRFKRGSVAWRKAKAKAARLSALQSRQRREWLHQWTTGIIRQAASLTVSTPKIGATIESARGNTKRWGAAVRTVAVLNRAILEQAPAAAIAMLEYKAAEAGVRCDVIVMSDHHTSIGKEISQVAKLDRRARRKLKKAA